MNICTSAVKKCTQPLIFGAGLLLAAHSWAQPAEGFSTICTLDESCAVDDSTLVGFGADGEYVYRSMHGAFVCTGTTFGVDDAPEQATCVALTVGDALNGDNGDAAEIAPPVHLEEGVYALVSRFSGKGLEVKGAAQKDGAKIVQNDFHQKPHQLWYVTPLEDHYYSISALHSDQVLEVRDWSISDGAKLEQTPWLNSWNQHWRIEPVDNGYFKVQSRFTGKVLDVYEMNRNAEGDIRTWTYWGGENQHWRLVPINLTPSLESSAPEPDPASDQEAP